MNKILKFHNVLVTGGAGFIGSHLVNALLEQNCRVVIIDDLSTGCLENVHSDAIFYKLSTTDKSGIGLVFDKERPEVVFQLAANTNLPRSVIDPLFDFQTLHGALNIIDACREFSVKKVIFVSSGFIYGNTIHRPIKEEEPFKPLSPYGITKKTIEYYLLFYREVYKLPYALVRPATVYGPRQKFGAMADYFNKISRGEHAEIYGNGLKTRDYLFVDDAVDALLSLTNISDDFKNPEFNLGTGKETTLNELYNTIALLLGKSATPIYLDERAGELDKHSLDSSRLEVATGWRPIYSLKDGLQEIIKYNRTCHDFLPYQK